MTCVMELEPGQSSKRSPIYFRSTAEDTTPHSYLLRQEMELGTMC